MKREKVKDLKLKEQEGECIRRDNKWSCWRKKEQSRK